jgi:hypothetical protein
MKVEHNVKDRKTGCPFGHTCDDCNLYIPLYRTDKDGEITTVYNCQFNNLTTLSDELKNRMTGVQGAVESRMNSLLALAGESQRRRLNGN